ncbi:DNA excision repair protein ERCC-5 [Bombina bombina]|uniref:DNA excision repair protein ERCC-5 n=1 Tax=Bombina bombina TaxID=8345 RepID=UPI00235AB936|nr:DNA excision repair protein ERCC-5 [Bombina bombina]
MGVQGLWKLLESSGRSINPETLEGKILAVDISIWLNQAIKGVRDRQGNAIQNAHLLTLFHRLCKLLFFRIRPIFVFDGEAPLLKKQTISKRMQKKHSAASEAKKTNEKLLRTFLKRQAIKAALSTKQSNEDIPSLSQVKRKDIDDVYVLPPLEEKDINSSEEEEEREWEERMTHKQILQEEFFANPHSVDIESEDFSTLPPEVKHEILTDMKEFTKRRRTLFEAMPEGSDDFSQYQLKGLLKKNNLNKCLDNVRKEMNQQYSGEVRAQFENEGGFLKEVETQRLVSEDTSHYILIKGIQSKADDKKNKEDTKDDSSVASYSETTPKTYLDLKLAASYKPKKTQNNSAEAAPPSPRTLFAIQEAMMENSSEDELGDKGVLIRDKKASPSVTRVDGSISPRTLQAIQQVLAEDEAGERCKKRMVLSDEELEKEQPKTKVLLISSSDEEDINLDNKDKSHPEPAIALKNNELLTSSTLCQKSFGNNQSLLNNPVVSERPMQSNELIQIKENQASLDEQCISSAKRNLFSDQSQSPTSFFSHASVPSVKGLHTSPVMSSVVEVTSTSDTSTATEQSYLNEQCISSAKRHLFSNQCELLSLPLVSSASDPSIKELDKKSISPTMHSITGYTSELGSSVKTGIAYINPPMIATTTDTCTLQTVEKLAVVVETAREEIAPKPSTSLDRNCVASSQVADLLEANIHQQVSNKSEGDSSLAVSSSPSKVSEFIEPKEENYKRPNVLNRNDADITYMPLTPESIDVSEAESNANKDMDSDSDGSFIEVDSDLSSAKAAAVNQEFATKQDFKESSSSDDLASQNRNIENSFTDDKDIQLANLDEPENSRDMEAAVNEWQDISLEELESLENNLFVEQTSLQAHKQQQERVAASVTGEMCQESQELLRLFGIPYIIAPMEAEAQCAVLDLTDQTSGTITDDSDIWLFGARHVYKNFFSHNKYMEYYQFADIHNQLGLDRAKLINLAYLLGSDYTEGISSVGYVSAMEILNEFPGHGLESLLKFKEWWTEAQKNKKSRPNPNDTKVKKKLRDIELYPGFPNPAVAEAYLKPTVDDSNAAFSWGRPDLEQIREFCESRFGWYRSKTDEVLLPVLKQLNYQQTQLRIDSFFRIEQHEAKSLKSQRLRRAVTCMKRKLKEGEAAEVEEATALMEEEECAARKQRKRGKSKPEKSSGGKKKMAVKMVQENKTTVNEEGGFIEGKNKAPSLNKSSSNGPESEAEDATSLTNLTKISKELRNKKDELSGSSSSSDDEVKAVLVTAKPVFQGSKRKPRNVKGKKK